MTAVEKILRVKAGVPAGEKKITVKMLEISLVLSYGCEGKENNGRLKLKILRARSC